MVLLYVFPIVSACKSTKMCSTNELSPANRVDQEPQATDWLPQKRREGISTHVEKVQTVGEAAHISSAHMFLSLDPMILRRSSSSQVFTKSRILDWFRPPVMPIFCQRNLHHCMLFMPICHQSWISEVDLGCSPATPGEK